MAHTKTKLTQRIVNAVRALRGEHLILDIPLPVMEVKPRELETFQVEHTVSLMALDMQGPEVIAAIVRQDLAASMGKGLMDAGAIEITKNVDVYRDTLTYRAKVRVAMPEGVPGNG